MKVIFIPDYRECNPYQKFLANLLSAQGIEVEFGCIWPYFSVLRAVKRYGIPHILHIHWQHPFILAKRMATTAVKSVTLLFELLSLKVLGVKIVWTVHNITNHEDRFSSIELLVNKLISRLSDKILVHSLSSRETVMRSYRLADCSKIKVIPHGHLIDYYENRITKSEARKRLGIAPHSFIFLYFGTAKRYKGIPNLVRTFAKLNVQQAKLLIAGLPQSDGIARDIAKTCNEHGNIEIFFSFIDDNDIQIYMNAADIVVLPYENILTSGSVILSMSFHKPLIAPTIGCISELLSNEGGFPYDPSDPDGLFRAMESALGAGSDALKRMGEHNFQRVKRFNWNGIARRLSEVYEECFS